MAMLFTDGSVNTLSHVGYGAYLLVPENEYSIELLKTKVILKKFTQTSSTKLELQTLLWALGEIQPSVKKIAIYTDSQNIISLPRRREGFEKNNYRSKKNKLLNNFELYIEFYKITDNLDCEFIKVQGHQVAHKKDHIARLFTLVDRASRIALRGNNK